MQRGNLVLIAVLVLGVIILIGSIANNFGSRVSNSPAVGGRDSGNQNAPDDDNGCPDVEGCDYSNIYGGGSGGTSGEAMDDALEDCEADRQDSISQCNTQIQGQQQVCWDADCLAVTGPMSTGSPCSVIRCWHYEPDTTCEYDVDKDGELIFPGRCWPHSNSENNWACSARDGSVTQSISCIPTPGEGGSAGGGGGDN